MSWSARSREVIAQIHARMPENATLTERKAALKDAYPFGPRQYWPYRAWCKARREYLARFITGRDAEAKRAVWRDQMRGQGYLFAGDDQ